MLLTGYEAHFFTQKGKITKRTHFDIIVKRK